MKNQDKHAPEAVKDFAQGKLPHQHYPPAKSTAAVISSTDINNHHQHHNLYYQSQAKAVQLNSQIGLDAKLLHAQSPFGAVGSTAAVAAQRMG